MSSTTRRAIGCDQCFLKHALCIWHEDGRGRDRCIVHDGERTNVLKLLLNGTGTLDADIAQLKTGTATQVSIESIGPQGTILFGGDRSQSNDINFVGENATGATYTISGDASTSIAGGFANAVIVDGSGHTGDLYITGSSGNDQFKGGSGNNTFQGEAVSISPIFQKARGRSMRYVCGTPKRLRTAHL